MYPRLSYSTFQNNLLSSFIFLFVFILLLFTVCPSVYWLDTGEFLSAISCLGLPHSPSFPTYTLAAHPLIYLPIGNIASRGNLSSAIWGALCAVIVFKLFLLIAGSPKSRLTKLIGSITAIAITLNPLMWYQCMKAEVYSLNLFFLLLVVYIANHIIYSTDTSVLKLWSLIVVVVGLGFGTHMLLTAHIAPALIFLLLISYRKINQKNLILLIILPILIGSIYLYLPIRSAQNPGLDLGNPEHFRTFINSVSRTGSFERFFGNKTLDVIKNIPDYFHLYNQHIPFLIWIFTMLGCFYLLVNKLPLISFMAIAAFTNIFVTLMNRNFNVNPDTGPAYLMLSTAIWIILAGIGFNFLIQKIQISIPSKKFTIPVIAIGISALTLTLGLWIHTVFVHSKLANDYSAANLGHAVLENCQPDAILFSGFRSNIRFVISYLQIAENYRSDIFLIDRAEVVYWPGGLEKLLLAKPNMISKDISPIMKNALQYLGPRGIRHGGDIPVPEARNIILNFLASSAKSLSETQPVYWFPSADDILLNDNIRAEGAVLKINKQYAIDNDHGPDQNTWDRYAQRFQLHSHEKYPDGLKILLELLVNLGNSLDNAGIKKAALETYNIALNIDPDFDPALRNRNILLQN